MRCCASRRGGCSGCVGVSALVLVAWIALAGRGIAQTSAPKPEVEAGFGKGVTIRTTDDKASLNIRARIQLRATAFGEPDDGQDDVTEVAIRRMRLVVQGNADGPALTYYVQLSFSNLDTEADLRLPLRDAYVTWAIHRDVSVRAGQMKVPFSRQRVTSSSALSMVDRSIVVTELNLDRDVGIQAFSKDLFGVGKLGYAAGLFGGEGRNRLGRAAGLLYTLRLEAWPLGAFDDYVEGDARRARPWRLAFGANVGHNQNTNRPRSTIGVPYAAGDFDYTHASADAVVKKRGFFAISELMYRTANEDSRLVPVNGVASTIWSRSGWGGYVQAGQMLSEHVEVSGRFSKLQPGDQTDPSFVAAREAGVGLSYYANGHDLKVQTDYFRVTDAATGQPVHTGRVQMQLFF